MPTDDYVFYALILCAGVTLLAGVIAGIHSHKKVDKRDKLSAEIRDASMKALGDLVVKGSQYKIVVDKVAKLAYGGGDATHKLVAIQAVLKKHGMSYEVSEDEAA